MVYFNLWKMKRKTIRQIHTLYHKVLWLFFLHTVLLKMIILELLVCGWCWYILVHPICMLTVDWSCHSLLLIELFIDAFTLFPTGAAWLGCPNLGTWLGILATHMYTHCYGVVYHTYTARRAAYTYIQFITSITLLSRVNRTCCSQPLLSGTVTHNLSF